MADLYELKHRIASIKQTRQITNAMYLLSTSRMRKATLQIEQNKQYYHRVRAAMKDILLKTRNVEHTYLRRKDIESPDTYIVIAGDKGMAGSFNNDVLKYAASHMQKMQRLHLITVGNKAQNFFLSKADDYGLNIELEVNFPDMANRPSLSNARKLAFYVQDFYDIGLMDQVHLVFTQFDGPEGPRPIDYKLLPLDVHDYEDAQLEHEYGGEFIYEPSPQQVFDTLVPQFLIGEIYGAFVHSFASENRARMMSMENATSNADEMIADFTQQFNTARQERITNELTELISAANVFNEST